MIHLNKALSSSAARNTFQLLPMCYQCHHAHAQYRMDSCKVAKFPLVTHLRGCEQGGPDLLHDLRRQRDFNYRSVRQHLHIHDGLRLNGTGIPLKLKCEGGMQRV